MLGKELQERTNKSKYLEALGACIKRARILAGDDRRALHTINNAMNQMTGIIEGYEIASRSVKMLNQMRKGEWPVENLKAVKKALEMVQQNISWCQDECSMDHVVNSIRTLVKNGEEDQQDNLLNASKMLCNVDEAYTHVTAVIAKLEEPVSHLEEDPKHEIKKKFLVRIRDLTADVRQELL